MEAFLAELPREFPGMKIIVLVDSLAQQQAALKAHSARVLLKGQLGGQLRAAILSCVASGEGLEQCKSLNRLNKCLDKNKQQSDAY
jgi:hypothetical protein